MTWREEPCRACGVRGWTEAPGAFLCAADRARAEGVAVAVAFLRTRADELDASGRAVPDTLGQWGDHRAASELRKVAERLELSPELGATGRAVAGGPRAD